MAIFVEGQTERIFAEKLLREIAGSKGLTIASFEARGGGKAGTRSLTSIELSKASSTLTHFAMIVDCGTDNRVRSDVGDQYDSLVAASYSVIVGIRDVFPDFNFSEIAPLRAGLSTNLKTSPVTVDFILGVMEIESWFIAEYTHFPRLDAALTHKIISSNLGFDPSVDDIQLRSNPAADLHDSYRLVSRSYNKKRDNVQRTVNLLDYATLYIQTKSRFNDLERFVDIIDAFLATQSTSSSQGTGLPATSTVASSPVQP